MKGIAVRYISLFVIGIVSLMVALAVFSKVMKSGTSIRCTLLSIGRILFGNDWMSESCHKTEGMETYQIYSGKCEDIATEISPYLIACWKKSAEGLEKADRWCYELYLQQVPDDCTPLAMRKNITSVLDKQYRELSNHFYLLNEFGKGSYTVYIFYNSSSSMVEII